MSNPATVIDAHQHFWERGRFDTRWLEAPDKVRICRSFLPADLKERMDRVGVARSIFVQTQHDTAENRWALELAEEYDWIAGVVGWVDLASSACEAQVEEFTAHPKFVGVRHITQDEPDDNFIVNPNVLAGLAVLERHRLPFDLLFFVKHLHHAVTLGRRFPELPLVIDHLSKPEIKLGRLNGWEANLRAAAQCENMYCKLSGMITEADWEHWKPANLRPYIDVALETFGPARLMFGSDWPVCELAGSYTAVFEALRDCLSELSAAEQAQIFGETAARFYRLPAGE